MEIARPCPKLLESLNGSRHWHDICTTAQAQTYENTFLSVQPTAAQAPMSTLACFVKQCNSEQLANRPDWLLLVDEGLSP